MRLFLLLVTALATVTYSSVHIAEEVTSVLYKFNLPTKFIDGTVISFFFRHKGTDDFNEPVQIEFFDSLSANYDRPEPEFVAFVQVLRRLDDPVRTMNYREFERGRIKFETHEQPLDEWPRSNDWWRVDVIKHDSTHMNVFFQGYWSDVRTFKKSLDDIRSIYVRSPHVRPGSVEIRYTSPNQFIAPLSVDGFKNLIYTENKGSVRLVTLPNFPVGSRIKMTVVLRASAGSKNRRPSLMFSPVGTEAYFFKIMQTWVDNERHQLTLAHGNGREYEMICTSDKPSGELRHIQLDRIAQNVLRMRLLFNPAGNKACFHELPWDISVHLNYPFDIKSRDGAVIFHFDHTFPERVRRMNKKDFYGVD